MRACSESRPPNGHGSDTEPQKPPGGKSTGYSTIRDSLPSRASAHRLDKLESNIIRLVRLKSKPGHELPAAVRTRLELNFFNGSDVKLSQLARAAPPTKSKIQKNSFKLASARRSEFFGCPPCTLVLMILENQVGHTKSLHIDFRNWLLRPS